MSVASVLRDFEQYADHCLWVKPRNGGCLVPFKRKPIQREIFRATRPKGGIPAKVIILKSRRLGASTEIAAEYLHAVSTHPQMRAVVVAHRGQDAANLFHIYERFHSNTPDRLFGVPIKPKRTGGRGAQIEFRNLDSSIEVVSAGTAEAGRGGDAQLIHLSEVAFYRDPEGFLAALLPILPAVGRGSLILESTANGPSDFFHDTWKAAVDGDNSYIPLFFPWFSDDEFRMPFSVSAEEYDAEEKELAARFGVDGYQIAWLREQTDTYCFGSLEKRRREYPATAEEAFTNIGGKCWEDSVILGAYEKREPYEAFITEKGMRRAKGGPLSVWEEPLAGAEYVMGGDPAGGLQDGDDSVLSVWRVDKKARHWPLQVAELAVKEDPITFAYSATILGTWYNKALLAMEVTGLGRGAQAALQKVYFYPRLHRLVPFDRYKSGSDTWGWETSWKSKMVMVGLADWLLRGARVTIRSPRLCEELMFFQQVAPEHYEGARGDDRVMAAMIAWCSWFQHSYPGVSLTEMRQKLAFIYGTAVRKPSNGEEVVEVKTPWATAVGRRSRMGEVQVENW